MPQFNYVGIKLGKKVTGAIVANNKPDAGKKLNTQKIILTNLIEIEEDVSNDDGPEIKTFLGMQLSSDKLSSVDIMLSRCCHRVRDSSCL